MMRNFFAKQFAIKYFATNSIKAFRAQLLNIYVNSGKTFVICLVIVLIISLNIKYYLSLDISSYDF